MFLEFFLSCLSSMEVRFQILYFHAPISISTLGIRIPGGHVNWMTNEGMSSLFFLGGGDVRNNIPSAKKEKFRGKENGDS